MALPYSDLVARYGLGDSHRLILAAIPDGARVLDVGCAGGYLARALAQRGISTVGIEPDPTMAAEAEEHCERVYRATVEEAQTLPELQAERFDVVIYGDVLEHLVDPLGALRWARGLLTDSGLIVVSIPNVAHWSVRWSLATGRFDYTDYGLLDRTHLRFFTRRTAHELVHDAGLEVIHEDFTPAPLPGEGIAHRLLARGDAEAGANGGAEPGPAKPRRIPDWASRQTLARMAPRLLAQQFVMTLRPVR